LKKKTHKITVIFFCWFRITETPPGLSSGDLLKSFNRVLCVDRIGIKIEKKFEEKKEKKEEKLLHKVYVGRKHKSTKKKFF
jgi:hypothetical protein